MPPPLREQASRVFSFFGGGGDSVSNRGGSVAVPPSLKLHTERDVYRPGDPVLITIEIPNSSPSSVSSLSQSNNAITSHDNDSNAEYSPLIEKLTFEMKGIEKLDTQWFTTLKPLSDSNQRRGIVPASTVLLDVYWKEMDGDTDWARANESYDGVEEGYDSSRDEISSVSSYNPAKENIHRASGSSLSLQSSVGRSSNQDASYLKEHTSIYPYVPLSQLSLAAEVLYDSGGDVSSPWKSSAMVSPSHQLKHSKLLSTEDDLRVPTAPVTVEPVASESFVRGRSYNIRLDDEVLLRFSPKNCDSSYYFSEMIGGTLTFFHEEGFRRCLEVHSDHHEVVADLVQSSFLFSNSHGWVYVIFHSPYLCPVGREFSTTPKNWIGLDLSILF